MRAPNHRLSALPSALVLLLSLGACRGKESSSEGVPAGSVRPDTRPGPRLAILMDDLGYDRASADRLFALGVPVSVAVLPLHPLSAEIAEQAHRRGYEVLLHLPMAPGAGDAVPEQVELKSGMKPEEVARLVGQMLRTVPHAVGVNNHQGSQATQDAELMDALMAPLKARRLFFVDSRTTGSSLAFLAARRAGLPAAYRTVFLDDAPVREAILRQLLLAERRAREQGWALAIGHPHPETLRALAEFLPGLSARGVRLVFASQLAR